MRRLLTGYAVSFNSRHRRYGHLFQNRYKSILCQEDPYLLELVRYIHLNPLRAGLVNDLRSLDTYRYSGHAVILKKRKYRLEAEGYDFNMVVDRVAHLMSLKREEVLSPGTYKKVVEARSVVCYWAKREIGISQGVLSQKFGISQPAISMAVKRGEQVVNKHNFSLLNT